MVDSIYPGISNTNSYLASGIPFLTGSTLLSSSFGVNNAEVKISFPYVARTVTVINASAVGIRVHFNSAATGSVITGRHYTTLGAVSGSMTYNVKCKEIYVSLVTGTANGSFELAAELTNIPASEMPALTGSGLTA